MAKKRLYLTWSNQNTRSKYMSYYFNLDEVYFGYLRSQKRGSLVALLRYPVLCIHTFIYLVIKMPDVAFSVNLPVFEPFVFWLWAKIFNRKYVIDNHSALFERSINTKLLWLVKPAFRHAALSTVTNKKYKEIIESWGGKAEILPPLVIPDSDKLVKVNNVKKKITAITSFDIDEPVNEILKAAEELSDYSFYLTGSIKNVDTGLIASKPKNVHFTDFISREEFLNLISESMCAIVLTKEDNTLLRGAYEAMSLEVPLIISDFQLLKDSFYKGVIHINNSPESIVQAVNKIHNEHLTFRDGIKQLKFETLNKLTEKVNQIHKYYNI